MKDFESLYLISNKGNVYSLITKKILTLKITHGYATHCVKSRNPRKYVRVHRCVAKAFIPNPENKPQVNHVDGNRSNNCVENLEWVTNRENMSHASINKKTSSKYVGVTYHKQRNKFRALCTFNGKRVQIGEFKEEYDAHLAYVNFLKDNNLENKYLHL